MYINKDTRPTNKMLVNINYVIRNYIIRFGWGRVFRKGSRKSELEQGFQHCCHFDK